METDKLVLANQRSRYKTEMSRPIGRLLIQIRIQIRILSRPITKQVRNCPIEFVVSSLACVDHTLSQIYPH